MPQCIDSAANGTVKLLSLSPAARLRKTFLERPYVLEACATDGVTQWSLAFVDEGERIVGLRSFCAN